MVVNPNIEAGRKGTEARVVIHPNEHTIVLHSQPAAKEATLPRGTQATTTSSSSSSSSTQSTVDTSGWDTEFVIRLSDVNQALSGQEASPGSFDNDLGGGYAVSGVFGPWQVIMGGSGGILRLSAPIEQGTMTYNDGSYPMDGATAIVEFNLTLVPPPPAALPPPTAQGSRHELRAKTTSTGPTDPAAWVIALRFPEGSQPTEPYVSPLMQGALSDWFANNMDRFEHVFSVVDLNVLADQEGFQWLKPSATSYAYADGADENSSFFGVLCTTGQRDTTGLARELSTASVPDGERSCFLIGAQTFLENSVLPGLPTAFADASPDAFVMADDGDGIVLAPGATVAMEPVEHGGSVYQPLLETFELRVQETEIVTDVTARIHVFPGVDVCVYTTTYQTLELVQKADGSQTLGYQQTRPPESSHENIVSPGVQITVDVLVLLTFVAGACTGGAADAVEAVVIAAIVIAIVGTVEITEQIVTNVLTNGAAAAMPPMDPMVYAATDPIQWPTQQSRFTLTSVALNGAIQMGGDPGFAEQTDGGGGAREM